MFPGSHDCSGIWLHYWTPNRCCFHVPMCSTEIFFRANLKHCTVLIAVYQLPCIVTYKKGRTYSIFCWNWEQSKIWLKTVKFRLTFRSFLRAIAIKQWDSFHRKMMDCLLLNFFQWARWSFVGNSVVDLNQITS